MRVMQMEKGHVEFGEIALLALLLVGLGAGYALLSSAGTAPPGGETAQTGARDLGANDSQPSPEPESSAAGAPAASSRGEGVQETASSIGELLDEGLARGDSRFFAAFESGEFDIHTYRWAMSKFNESPDLISIRANDLRASEIRFEGRYDDSLRGFGFRTYDSKGLTAPPKYFGTMVFLSNAPAVDAYFRNGTIFDMQYDPHPELSQILEGCSILGKQELATSAGSPISIYDFSCKIMYGASS